MNETVTSYRSCFGTDPGKRVLGDLLINGGYFDDDLTTPEEQAVQNFVKQIIKKLGIDGPDMVGMYIQKLMELPSKGN